ncbi:hypothetical protein [Arvimicrobium flavum]|uniref:hypothetical protein n=1 Tax=Arvimicrobium flavum TaxID=3393320 RepID=UPI00237B40EB|nr:hypothetical protein [Mesorhizobium shangrilense]
MGQRLNYEGIVNVGAVTWLAVTFATLASAGIGVMNHAKQQWVDAVKATIDAPVVGRGQSELRMGPLKYLFDFESGVVFIENGGHQATVGMDDFDNQTLLEAVRQRGCAAPAAGARALDQLVCE